MIKLFSYLQSTLVVVSRFANNMYSLIVMLLVLHTYGYTWVFKQKRDNRKYSFPQIND